MYICICKAITDKQLEETKKRSKTFRELCKNLGLGSECGACIQEASQYIEKMAQQSQNSSIKQKN